MRPAQYKHRRGMTLLELLVVIGIMLSLTATTIAMMRPALRGRRVREASRLLNVFINGARNRALETGRPVAAGIERVPGLAEGSITLSYYETPPAYSGDEIGSVAILTELPAPYGENYPNIGDVTYGVNFTVNAFSDGIVQSGDTIQFGGQAQQFRVISFNDNNGDKHADLDGLTPVATAVPGYNKMYKTGAGTAPTDYPMAVALYVGTDFAGNALPHPRTAIVPTTFQFIRHPVRMATGSVQLPQGTVVDLAESGWDAAELAPQSVSDLLPVLLVFSPRGAFERVYFSSTTAGLYDSRRLSTPLHLLVGKRERLPGGDPSATAGVEPVYNFQDSECRWVTIHPSTGLISSTENVGDVTATASAASLTASRQIALSAQNSGGR